MESATSLGTHNCTIANATGKNACNGVLLVSSDGKVDVVTGWSVFANTMPNSEGKGFVHCDLTSGNSLGRVAHGFAFANKSAASARVSESGFGSALVGLRNHGLNFGTDGWKAIRLAWKAIIAARQVGDRVQPTFLTNLALNSGFVFILPAYRDADDANQPDYSGRDHLNALFSDKTAKGIEAQGVGKVTGAYNMAESQIAKNLKPWDTMEIVLLPAEQAKFDLPETTTIGALCDAIARASGATAIPYSETRGDDFVTSIEAQGDAIDFSL